ncbi:hypothetical protein [Reyranella sp.]|uniref:hypothetical protein n=1 Tax=Reyranella sp. TaxID=1929291 RepID=UPI0037835CD6
MEYLTELAEWSELSFMALLLVVLFVVHEAGARIARRSLTREEKAPEGVNVIVGGLLGLLAFVLALTLSYASARFNERRAGALSEANVISTAWTRAEAIGHRRGKEIARLLEEYARVRQGFVEAGRDKAKLAEFNRTTQALQSEMTGHLAAIVQERPDTVSTSLMTSLNETFDAATTERFAYDRGLPAPVFWLLMSLSVLSAAALGYQVGFVRQRPRLLVAVLMLAWTSVTIVILDLASPRLGALRTNSDAYVWTLQSFKSGVQIPPAPNR